MLMIKVTTNPEDSFTYETLLIFILWSFDWFVSGLHKKSFPLRISLVNVSKSAVSFFTQSQLIDGFLADARKGRAQLNIRRRADSESSQTSI